MRRLLCPAVVVAALTCLPGVAAAQATPGDSVTGGFTDFNTALRGFNVDAHSGPSGEQPTGTVAWHFGGGLGPSWTGTVTCLSVSGSSATIGFSGTQFFFGDAIPVAGLIRVFDGGGPDSRQDTFESAETDGEVGGPSIPGPSDCSGYPGAFTPSFGVSTNDFGDLVVTDAQAMPTTKDQCKNGGWRAFGVFKNQGGCVSFVSRNHP